MPTRRDRWRALAALFVDDVWRKIAAVLLAVLLWLYLDQLVTRDKTLLLEPTPIRTLADPGMIGNRELGVALDLERYTVLAFRDPARLDADNVPVIIDRVEIGMRGSARLLRDVPDSVACRALPTVEQGPRGPMATLTLADIRPVDELLAGTLTSLEPPRILVELAENEVETLVLVPRMVAAPDIGGDLGERLRLEEASFEPPQVTVRGPGPELARLTDSADSIFRVDVFVQDGQKLRASLALIQPSDRVHFDVEPVALIPLETPAREFRLTDVPVVLHAPPGLAGAFRLRRPTEDVKIAATGRLENRLSGMTPDQLRRWIQSDALIVARLPRDADGADVIYASDAFLILGPDHREGRDYRLVSALTIHYEPDQR